MMHGPGLDHSYLRPWHDKLATRARIIYYDHRWSGRSGRGAAPDHASWHADAAALLDHLGERRAIIYGHSYGGWLAQGFAARFPDRVAGIVLCGSSVAGDHLPDAVAAALRRDPAAAAELIRGFGEPGSLTDAAFKSVWHAILPLYFAGAPRPDMLDGTRYSAAGYARAMEVLGAFDSTQTLRSLAAPCLVLNGDDDFLMPPEQTAQIVAAAPRARVAKLRGCGHFPFVEQTDAYLHAFQGWLADTFHDR